MNNQKDRNTEPATPPTGGLFSTLKAVFRAIADPDYRELAVDRLFSNRPICWEDLEADFPTLNRQEAAQHLVGRLRDWDKSTLYETIFALHPGLAYCIDPWPLNEPADKVLKGYFEIRDQRDVEDEAGEDVVAGMNLPDSDPPGAEPATRSLKPIAQILRERGMPAAPPSFAIALSDQTKREPAETGYWKLVVRREDVSVEESAAAEWGEGETASVQAVWMAGLPGMQVEVSGPLVAPSGCSARVVWISAEAGQHTASGKARFRFSGPVPRPADEDSLSLEHVDADARVVLRWSTKFAKGKTS